MKMKKTLMAVVLAAAIGGIGLQQASARGPEGRGPGHIEHRHFHKLDDATQQKIKKFQQETLQLRKQIVMKRSEEAALIRSEKPDIKMVRKTAGELFDLRMAMQEKARAAGIFPPIKAKGTDKKVENKIKKVTGFLAETKDLRRQIFIKRAERRALMHVDNPNAQEVAKVAGELFDLKTSLQEKAEAAGIERGFHGFGREKMEHGRRSHHRDFGLMGDNDRGQQGPDMGQGLIADETPMN
jgi:Spy/CpxP family protein refolding chaperone